MKLFTHGAIAFLFALAVLVPVASTHAATSVDDMLTQIKALMAQVEELQKQLATVKSEVQDVLKEGLSEGMTDDDIAKIQELLATDPTLYPEGKRTGYFGPLTKEAIKRFQTRHDLEVTGVINSETRDLLEEYLHEGFGGKIPPGLLKAPGIMKKVEDRYKLGCEKHGHGMGPLCKKLKGMHDDDSDDDDSDDDSDDDNSTTSLDVSVEINNGSTTVAFTFDGDDYSVTVSSTKQADVLSAVADELDTTVLKLDYKLKSEIKKELADELDDLDNTAEDDADDAIDEAKDAIDDADDAIDDADGDTAAAEVLLEDAEDKLDDAEDAFDDEDYAEAKDLAEDAEALAKDALNKVTI